MSVSYRQLQEAERKILANKEAPWAEAELTSGESNTRNAIRIAEIAAEERKSRKVG
ncbi:MAG: hypothetical protein VXZ82_24810 [Planctomycetota bacterium]|nr:hypothetical protein [Planctomycetota bacterium]